MVVRSSEVKPLAKKIGYRCLTCGEITEACRFLLMLSAEIYVEYATATISFLSELALVCACPDCWEKSIDGISKKQSGKPFSE